MDSDGFCNNCAGLEDFHNGLTRSQRREFIPTACSNVATHLSAIEIEIFKQYDVPLITPDNINSDDNEGLIRSFQIILSNADENVLSEEDLLYSAVNVARIFSWQYNAIFVNLEEKTEALIALNSKVLGIKMELHKDDDFLSAFTASLQAQAIISHGVADCKIAGLSYLKNTILSLGDPLLMYKASRRMITLERRYRIDAAEKNDGRLNFQDYNIFINSLITEGFIETLAYK